MTDDGRKMQEGNGDSAAGSSDDKEGDVAAPAAAATAGHLNIEINLQNILLGTL